MNKKEQALALFNQGFSCSQSVLCAFASDFNLDQITALKVAGGFGGGMGQLGETCGVVTAGFMVIGLKYGKISVNDTTSKGKTNKVIREFARIYQDKVGSLKCRELLGCDLSTQEGLRYAKENNLFKKICPDLIEAAVDTLEEILREK
ncbi:C_GCAxxG_C_C family probable redox protein [Desulfonispora thiosulfatigenes DSM 11270]|uniref:C_GCAxxG_C_C family probable redox protein n=1 Tax=Desulfonispora thiosulfatigenes DSM 11270 TaxID=656914 RepID=A0A1W1UFF6_DESTI|nr:C-GCAxxG-C-C family protein [Desulfonispora thiosulfatigenes]SMB79800.1 C_GCAxxG_C_C family probable redox protein [Desulfonispora thiosulfatigenes DSM 11270]